MDPATQPLSCYRLPQSAHQPRLRKSRAPDCSCALRRRCCNCQDPPLLAPPGGQLRACHCLAQVHRQALKCAPSCWLAPLPGMLPSGPPQVAGFRLRRLPPAPSVYPLSAVAAKYSASDVYHVRTLHTDANLLTVLSPVAALDATNMQHEAPFGPLVSYAQLCLALVRCKPVRSRALHWPPAAIRASLHPP